MSVGRYSRNIGFTPSEFRNFFRKTMTGQAYAKNVRKMGYSNRFRLRAIAYMKMNRNRV